MTAVRQETAGALGPWPKAPTRLTDLLAITKPRVTAMVLVTTATGLGLAPSSLPLHGALLTLAATAMVVGAANALNCWVERVSDGLMTRTRQRPLPAGRLDATTALAFGVILGVVAVALLTFAVNALTGLLAAVALTSYVLLYTPMKRVSPDALLVGAVPGALPPLMGWTAATGSVGAVGVVLAAILFLWQLPHFMAIALMRKDEYARAGLRILPVVLGVQAARRRAVLYTAALVPVSWLLVPCGGAGPVYGIGALGLGLAFLGVALAGLRRDAARALFLASLAYLPLLSLLGALDAR